MSGDVVRLTCHSFLIIQEGVLEVAGDEHVEAEVLMEDEDIVGEPYGEVAP